MIQTETQSKDIDQAEQDHYRLHRRFDRMGRLIGDEKMKRLMESHVMIIGLGGVGSWCAEAIARAGVGTITLIDFDEICVTNFNRQIHAVQGNVGQQKAEVMGERLRKINPQAKIEIRTTFYTKETAEALLTPGKDSQPDFVIDAIDHITAKCHLLSFCKAHEIPIVCVTGSGGRLDPTRIRTADLASTQLDPLARDVRKILREKYSFPEKGPFEIPAVYSDEPIIMPQELTYDGGKGFRCVCPQGDNGFFTCDNRNLIMGSAGFVTGSFGLAAASVAVRHLLQ